MKIKKDFVKKLSSAALLAASASAFAGTATVSGILSSFDVNNDSGQDAHGFEIQIDNSGQNDLYYTGWGQRYGSGTVSSSSPTSVSVRWASPVGADGSYSQTTPQHVGAPDFSWQSCYLGGAGYAASGCEHFSQGLRWPINPSMTASGYWLLDDGTGHLVRNTTPVAIPVAVVYTFVPPPTVTTPPVVVAEIEAPEPPEVPGKYGTAQWMKVYKTVLDHAATQADLDNSNLVPADAIHSEIGWQLLQVSPPSGCGGVNSCNQNRNRTRTQGPLTVDTRSIVRRIETYKFTGGLDAITNQAICADGTCNAPAADEVGDLIGATTSAINVTPDVIAVSKTGPGGVTGAGLNCGNNCVVFGDRGTTVTLTASPSSGAVFLGWGGLCSGTSPTCAVTVNGISSVTAAFGNTVSVSVGKSNGGTVVATPNGTDRALNCGNACSAKFVEGSIVTVTATPPAGKSFISWEGGCVGTNPSCSFTVSKATSSVKANFSK